MYQAMDLDANLPETFPGARFCKAIQASVDAILAPLGIHRRVISAGVRFCNIDTWTGEVFAHQLCDSFSKHPERLPDRGELRDILITANSHRCSDPHIRVARMPDRVTHRVALAIIGGGYHEAWHTKYSKRDHVTVAEAHTILDVANEVVRNGGKFDAKMRGLVMTLHHLIEDIRIERRGNEDFPGAYQPMCDLQDFILDLEARGREQGAKIKNVTVTTNARSIMLSCFRDLGLGYNTERARETIDYYRAVAPGVVALFSEGGMLLPMLEEAQALTRKDTMGSLRVAMKIVVQLWKSARGTKQEEESPETCCPRCGASAENLVMRSVKNAVGVKIRGRAEVECKVCGFKTEIDLPDTSLDLEQPDPSKETKSPEVEDLDQDDVGAGSDGWGDDDREHARDGKQKPKDDPSSDEADGDSSDTGGPEREERAKPSRFPASKSSEDGEGECEDGEEDSSEEGEEGEEGEAGRRPDAVSEQDSGDDLDNGGSEIDDEHAEETSEDDSDNLASASQDDEDVPADEKTDLEDLLKIIEDALLDGAPLKSEDASEEEASVKAPKSKRGRRSSSPPPDKEEEQSVADFLKSAGGHLDLGQDPALRGIVPEDVLEGAEKDGRLDHSAAMHEELQHLMASLTRDLQRGERIWNPFNASADEARVLRVADPTRSLSMANGMLSAVNSQIASLRARFRAIFRAQEMTDVSHGVRRGRKVSNRMLVDSKADLRQGKSPSRAYVVEDTKTDTSVALVACLDQSGSMVNMRLQVAKCMMVLVDPIERAGGATMAFGFRNGTYVGYSEGDRKVFHRADGVRYDIFKKWEEHFDSVKSRFAHTMAEGGTPMADGVQYGLTALNERAETHRILAVVTDGVPDSPHEQVIQRQVRLAKAAGIHVLGIGIGNEALCVQRLFPDHVWAGTVEELPPLLITKITTLLDFSGRTRGRRAHLDGKITRKVS